MRGGKRPADRDRDVALFLVSLGFVLGTVAGYLLVGALGSEVWSERFLGTADLAPATLRQESWAVLRWPVAVVLLSLLPLAGLTIPVLFFLRGLFLSHAVAALTAAGGPVGPLSAVVLLGPTGLLAVPAFFVLGTLGLLRQVDPGRRGLVPAAIGCAAAFALCILLDRTVAPALLERLLRLAAS